MNIKKVQTPLVCHGHTRPIVELEYSPVTPDGYFLASASKDGQPMLRNGETGDWIGTFQGHKGCVWSCVLNGPGLLAATASADFTARIWDALSGEELHNFPHKHIVRTTQFASDCHRFVTAGHEKLIRVFDVQRPDAPAFEFASAANAVRCASWIQSDNLLLTSYIDLPGITVWDTRTLQPVRTMETPSTVTSIEVSNDGQHITTADGKDVRFWSGGSLQQQRSYTMPWATESASYCHHKKRFAAGGEDMWVHLYDYETGEELECNKGHHGPVHCVRFAPGGETYASGSEDGTIRIWQTDFFAKEDGSDAAAAAVQPVNGNADVAA